MLKPLAVAMALVWGASSLPNGVQFQYGASPDAGQVDDGVTYAGNVYYIDFDNGNDTNSGRSKGAPWKTVARVNQACFGAGNGTYSEAPRNSAFLFKRGQSDQTGNIHALGCDITGYFCSYTFGVYGTGARPKIIYGTGMPGSDFNGVIGCIGRASAGVTRGGTVRNLHLVGDLYANPSSTTGSAGVFFTWADGITVTNCEVELCGGGGIILALNDSVGNSANGGAVVFNNTVHDCCLAAGTNGAGIGGGGGTLGPAPGVLITYNTCFDNGQAGSLTSHQVYVYDLGTGSAFWGNYCYATKDRGNNGFVIHGVCTGLAIQRNLILSTNNGISIVPGYATAEYFDLFDISNNIIGNCGQYGTQGNGVQLTSVTNTKVYCNLLYGNTFRNGTAEFLIGAGGTGDATLSNVEIAHNTIYRPTGTFTSGSALNVSVAAGTLRWLNNIVYESGTGNSQWMVLKSSAMTDANLTMAGNCYFTGNASKTHSWNGTSYTLAAFKTAVSGAEAGTVYADPRFVNAGTLNFQLLALSPAIGIGATGYGYTAGLDLRALSSSAPTAGCYAAPT